MTTQIRTLLIVGLGALLLLACSETAAKGTTTPPSKVEPIQGSNLSRVTLLESAAQRIAVQTAPVTEAAFGLRGEPGPRKMVPYSAVIYDLTGGAWVYTNPDKLTYLREPIHVDYVQSNTAVLFAGPNPGTQVVIVGAAELYGAETGVK